MHRNPDQACRLQTESESQVPCLRYTEPLQCLNHQIQDSYQLHLHDKHCSLFLFRNLHNYLSSDPDSIHISHKSCQRPRRNPLIPQNRLIPVQSRHLCLLIQRHYRSGCYQYGMTHHPDLQPDQACRLQTESESQVPCLRYTEPLQCLNHQIQDSYQLHLHDKHCSLFLFRNLHNYLSSDPDSIHISHKSCQRPRRNPLIPQNRLIPVQSRHLCLLIQRHYRSGCYQYGMTHHPDLPAIPDYYL